LGIILFFARLETAILSALGVIFPVLQVALGIILYIIAVDMIFESRIGARRA
jgi:small neutral amino acid transporter SnatA (MarC family)